uniref:Ig-like domain-containing protein n=1 Tax=Fundulus heteroclitus TaxID=8078 RepID=A0A3Q2P1Z9_FUNHE
AVFVCELSHADASDGVWWLGASALGSYSCQAGSAETTATVSVRGAYPRIETLNMAFYCVLLLYLSSETAPFFKKELRSVEAEEGGAAFLQCELSKAGVSVQWKKDGLPLRESRKYKMKQDGCLLQLHMDGLKAEDSGSYTCQAGGTETAANVTVRGDYPFRGPLGECFNIIKFRLV